MRNVKTEERHMQALMAPRSPEEQALTFLVRGLEKYVMLLQQEDAAISPAQRQQISTSVADLTSTAFGLLDGPLGRLDATLLRDRLAQLASSLAGQDEIELGAPRSASGRLRLLR